MSDDVPKEGPGPVPINPEQLERWKRHSGCSSPGGAVLPSTEDTIVGTTAPVPTSVLSVLREDTTIDRVPDKLVSFNPVPRNIVDILPQEITSLIFESYAMMCTGHLFHEYAYVGIPVYAVGAYVPPPWRLGSICRAWRIWSTISIDISNDKQLALAADLVSLWISRSGALPLLVHLHTSNLVRSLGPVRRIINTNGVHILAATRQQLHDAVQRRPWPHTISGGVQNVDNLLSALTKVSTRWRAVRFDFPSDSHIMLPFMRASQTPLLKHIRLVNIYSEMMLNRDVALHIPLSPNYLSVAYRFHANMFNFRNLVCIHMFCPHLDQFLTVMQRAGSLRSCIANMVTILPGQRPLLIEVTSHSLHRLVLDGDASVYHHKFGFLHRLVLPSLEDLEFLDFIPESMMIIPPLTSLLDRSACPLNTLTLRCCLNANDLRILLDAAPHLFNIQLHFLTMEHIADFDEVTHLPPYIERKMMLRVVAPASTPFSTWPTYVACLADIQARRAPRMIHCKVKILSFNSLSFA